jgi:hypothetical protein
MPAEEVLPFEEHSWNCTACLHGIHHSFEKMIVEKEQRENDTLLQKTFGLMDRLDRTPVNNMLDMVIRASGKLLELLSTTGELLQAPVLAPVRGETASIEQKDSLRIVQEFIDPPVSLQVSVEKDKEVGILSLKISLYDQNEEEFMPGIEIELTGGETSQIKISDENGEALFRIEKPGEYILTLTVCEEEIGEISLTLV